MTTNDWLVLRDALPRAIALGVPLLAMVVVIGLAFIPIPARFLRRERMLWPARIALLIFATVGGIGLGDIWTGGSIQKWVLHADWWHWLASGSWDRGSLPKLIAEWRVTAAVVGVLSAALLYFSRRLNVWAINTARTLRDYRVAMHAARILRMEEQDRRKCWKCGYSRAGLDDHDRCPECGVESEPAPPRRGIPSH